MGIDSLQDRELIRLLLFWAAGVLGFEHWLLELTVSLMDKKKKKGGTAMNPRPVHGMTLREENSGKKHVNVSSMLRMEHLQKLAAWASVEAGIPPLGAFFGHRLAASVEAEGVPLDPSTFVCHRCESILQPGFNCTVRIEKNVKKAKCRKKTHIPSQNNVVYRCHFCSHPNILRGTQRGYVKSLLPSTPETNSNIRCSSTKMTSNSEEKLDQKVDISLAAEPAAVARGVSLEKSPSTPLDRLTNLAKNRKRKKNGPAPNNASSSGSSSVTLNSATAGSSKRKRKGWSSLKEIAERNEALRSQSIGNFAIPFSLQSAK